MQSPDPFGAFACPEGSDPVAGATCVNPALPALPVLTPGTSGTPGAAPVPVGVQLAQLEALARRELSGLLAAAPVADPASALDLTLASLAWDLGLDAARID